MQDGKPVISDFGIALAVGVAGGGRLTETGLSLGTPHYMSPEQATGDQNVGPQTDTYALGCVLHEMLVGEPPYTGPNAQAVLGQIIAGETASVTRKRPSVPANVDAAVRKALEKLPADRFTTAEGLLRALGDHGFRHGVTAGAASVGNGHIWASSGLVALTVLAGAVIGVIASPLVWLRADGSTASVVRFDVTVPDAERVSIQGGTPLSLSPDGAHLVFVGSDGASTSLYIRRLSEREARRIPGTEGATEPFFSPTGEEIGFLAGGTMQRISIDGGAPLPILDLPTGQIVGASWGTDGMIVFTEPAAGLAMVPAEGGEPTVLTQIDRAAGEFDHVFPQITPGGKTVLFTVRLREESTIAALTLETGEWESFRDGSVAVRYLPSGYLLYPEAGALVAQPFDLDRLEATGPSVPVLDSVVTRTSRAVDVALFDVSSTGTLAYVHGRYSESLAWVTGDGTVTRWGAPERGYWYFRLSPDDQRVAATIPDADDQDEEVWILETGPGGRRTLLTDAGDNITPIWTPDGARVTYSSNREGDLDIYWQAPDIGDDPEPLLVREYDQFLGDWSPDGKVLAFGEEHPETGLDVWLLTVDPASEPIPLLTTASREHQSIFSPNGRWLAYTSDETGRDQVYVMPVPTTGQRRPITANGGSEPQWSRDGSELYFRRGSLVLRVDLTEQNGELVPGLERTVPIVATWYNNWFQGFDIAADGRVLATSGDIFTSVEVVLNWADELKERVGN